MSTENTVVQEGESVAVPSRYSEERTAQVIAQAAPWHETVKAADLLVERAKREKREESAVLVERARTAAQAAADQAQRAEDKAAAVRPIAAILERALAVLDELPPEARERLTRASSVQPKVNGVAVPLNAISGLRAGLEREKGFLEKREGEALAARDFAKALADSADTVRVEHGF